MQKALLYEQGQQVLHNLVWQLSHYTAINYAHLNLEFCHFMSHKSLNMHAEEGSHWHIAGFEAGFEAFAWIACATDENGCWLSQSVKSLFWVCPHLCNKIWVSATTGMHVKRAIVNLPSGWKEIQYILSLKLFEESVGGWPRTRILVLLHRHYSPVWIMSPRHAIACIAVACTLQTNLLNDWSPLHFYTFLSNNWPIEQNTMWEV